MNAGKVLHAEASQHGLYLISRISARNLPESQPLGPFPVASGNANSDSTHNEQLDYLSRESYFTNWRLYKYGIMIALKLKRVLPKRVQYC